MCCVSLQKAISDTLGCLGSKDLWFWIFLVAIVILFVLLLG